MKVSITKTQWFALNDLRGLPERAHMLVMCSIPSEGGAVLEGSCRCVVAATVLTQRVPC